MNIYRIILIFLIGMFLCEEYLKKNIVLYSFLKKFTVLVLICLIGFRNGIARDDSAYIEYFVDFKAEYDYIFCGKFEIFYSLLNGAIKLITHNYRVVFILSAAICMINLYKFISFFSVSFFSSIIFYYCRWLFLRDFTQIRSGIACSFFYLGLIELYKKRKLKFLLYILIGAGFHKAILIGLILPLYLYMVNKFKLFRIVLYISIVTIPLLHLRNFLENFLILCGIPIVYIKGIYSVSKSNIVYNYSVCFLVVLIIFEKYLYKIKYKFIFLKAIYLLSCFLGAIFLGFGDISGRLASYFNTEFILQDKLLYCLKNKIIYKIIWIIFIVLLYYVNFTKRLEFEYWNYF